MSHESFWDFSLRVYRLPQMSQTCLTLQNVHGFDVNVLLFACWFARRHGQMPAPLLHEVLQFSTQWSGAVVTPLRRARTWMKAELAQTHSLVARQPEAEDLRERIKAVELRAEKLQQQALESLAQEYLAAHARSGPQAAGQPGTGEAIAHNLQSLSEASAVTLTPALAALLQILQKNATSD